MEIGSDGIIRITKGIKYCIQLIKVVNYNVILINFVFIAKNYLNFMNCEHKVVEEHDENEYP